MKFQFENEQWIYATANAAAGDYGILFPDKFNPYDWQEVGHNSTHVFWVRATLCENKSVDIKVLNTITQGTSVRTYTIEEADRLYLGHE